MKEGVDAKSLSFWRFFFSNPRYWIAPAIGIAILMIALTLWSFTNSQMTNFLISVGWQFMGWGITFSIWFCILDYRRVLLNIEPRKKP